MGGVPPQLRHKETIPLPEFGPVSVGVGTGGKFLVIEMAGGAGPSWACAPVSDRALDCVKAGRTSPWTVMHHSTTGTVDIYRTEADGTVRESVVLCSALSESGSTAAA